MNIFFTVDFRFPNCHDEKTLKIRTYISLARCLIISFLTMKLGLISIFDESLPQLRLFMLDWTILYPKAFRIHMVRSFFSLVLIGSSLKRAILLTRNFHGNILEFMIQDPRFRNVRSDISESTNNKSYDEHVEQYILETKNNIKDVQSQIYRTHLSDKCELAHESEFLNFIFFEIWRRLAQLLKGTPIRLPAKDIHPNPNHEKAFHSVENWFRISRQFEIRFKMIVLNTFLIYGTASVVGCVRILLLIRSQPETCLRCKFLGCIGLFETTMIFGDGIMDIIGLVGHINLVLIYFDNLFKWTRSHLRDYICQLDEAVNSDRFKAISNEVSHKDINARIGGIVEFEKSVTQKGGSGVLNKQSLTKSWSLQNANIYMFYSTQQQTFRPLSSINELEGYLETRHIISDKNFDWNSPGINRNLEGAKRLISDVLYAIDEQKDFISHLGVIEYMWLATIFSILPMFVIISRIGVYNGMPLLGFISSGIMTQLLCFGFVKICAQINYEALKMGKLMFEVCARYPSQKIHNEWSRMFYHWYYPARCVFKVAGVFEITYINIVRTISYIISMITLLLTYGTRFT